MDGSHRVFISCVSKEFRTCRQQLRSALQSPIREIKVQEDFIDGGKSLLELLDDYISRCHAVIHLIGSSRGHLPTPAEVRAILLRYPGLKARLPEIAVDLNPGDCPLSYTHWEAVLAV
jgi:hypothetical protein